MENVPKDAPVLFLPNHQSALMDVLLIVVDCNRKPFFLTRSDVFTKPALKRFFAYLRMIPIYRIRDGREALKKNQAVFEQCAEIFKQNHAIVMFPEANHNIKRRVRPLSKGFTRIVFNTIEKFPELNLHIVPVGLNYLRNDGFPDKVALYYDKSIMVKGMYNPEDTHKSVNRIKKAVSNRLKTLTTHIGDEKHYGNIATQLDQLGVDYLNPFETNRVVQKLVVTPEAKISKSSTHIFRAFGKGLFTILNFPILLLWRKWLKPKVWEPEFMGTLRFGYALLIYPIYYLVLFIGITLIFNVLTGLLFVVGLLLFNWLYVRLQ
ncbi:MAG: hypothetical protein HKN31_08905 [Pricia sp.]|nr:hypothetical protein [Pricia sp.]